MAPIAQNHAAYVNYYVLIFRFIVFDGGGSVAECRLEWWTQAQEGPGFKSQPRRCPVTVLGKLFTPIVPLFTKQQNW